MSDTGNGIGKDLGVELRETVRHDLAGPLRGIGAELGWWLREAVTHNLAGPLQEVGLKAAQELRETVKHDLRGSLTGFGLDAAKEIRETIKQDVNPVIDHFLNQVAKPFGAGGLKGVVSAELVPVIDYASGKMAETINKVVDNALRRFAAIVLGQKAMPFSLASVVGVGDKAAVDSAPAVVSTPGKVDDLDAVRH